MNEAIVRAGEWREQGEEGRLGWPVYWLDHMFSWPACYSALSSIPPLAVKLELALRGIISQNSLSIWINTLTAAVFRKGQCVTSCLFSYTGCVKFQWVTHKSCGFMVLHLALKDYTSVWVLISCNTTVDQQRSTLCRELLAWMSQCHVKRVSPWERPTVFYYLSNSVSSHQRLSSNSRGDKDSV